MGNIISGIIGGALAIILTAFLSNRKDRALLIEKWMNQLRDEVSRYLGKCEQLRLLGTDSEKKFDVSNPIYGELVSGMYRIELLLNKGKDDQKKLVNNVKELRKLADSKNWKDFAESEKTVVKTTVEILDLHWDKISTELKNPIVFLPNKIKRFVKRDLKR